MHGGGVNGGLGDPEEGWTPRRGRGIAIGWTILGIETLFARVWGLDPTCRVYLLQDTSLLSACTYRVYGQCFGQRVFREASSSRSFPGPLSQVSYAVTRSRKRAGLVIAET